MRVAVPRPFTVESIEQLRADVLGLVRNVARIRDGLDPNYEKLRAAIRAWRAGFFDRVYQDLDLTGAVRSRLTDGRLPTTDAEHDAEKAAHDAWKKRVGSGTWDLYITLGSFPFPKDWEAEKTRWAEKVRRAARKAWSVLGTLLDWAGAITEDVRTVEDARVEGFAVRMVGFEDDDYDNQAVGALRAGLRRYTQNAKRWCPALLTRPLPIQYRFDCRVGLGGRYEQTYVVLCASTEPGRLAQYLAHEMGHHLYRTVLSGPAVEYWAQACLADLHDLDLREVRDVWAHHADLSVLELVDALEDQEPALSLQLAGAVLGFNQHAGRPSWTTLDGLDAYLAQPDATPTLAVPAHPVTAYGTKDAEETFCEVLGLLIGYGPRAVDPVVRALFDTVTNQMVKKARTACFDAGSVRTAVVPTGLWYHGRQHKDITTRTRSPHGGPAHEVPIFLSPSKKFAALYAHNHGYVYTVRPRVTRTFDSEDLRVPSAKYVDDRDEYTVEGQKLFDAVVAGDIFPLEGEDDNGVDYLKAILKMNYDTMEHGAMVSWLKKNGYDSFYVTGDGEKNLAVLDPNKLEIVEVEPIGESGFRDPVKDARAVDVKKASTSESGVMHDHPPCRTAARPMKESAILALMAKMRKRQGTFRGAELKQVLEYLGWTVSEKVAWRHLRAYAGKDADDPDTYSAADLRHVEAVRDDYLAHQVDELPDPTTLKLNDRIYLDVGPVTEREGSYGKTYSFTYQGWQVATDVVLTGPGGHTWTAPMSLATWMAEYPNGPCLKWLYGETPFLQQVSDRLGLPTYEAEKADRTRARTRDNTGTCPACFRNQKMTPGSLHGSDRTRPGMVLHGYMRPGLGYVVGNCFGQGWPPFELSSEGTVAWVARLHDHVHAVEVSIANLESGKVEVLIDREKPVKKTDVPEHEWNRILHARLDKLRHELKSVERTIDDLDKAIKSWTLAPLPGTKPKLSFRLNLDTRTATDDPIGSYTLRDEGDFIIHHSPQVESTIVDDIVAKTHKAIEQCRSAGLPIVDKLHIELRRVGGASNTLAHYSTGSNPPTIVITSKSYKRPDLVSTIIHELGHYIHDKVVPGGKKNIEIQSRYLWALGEVQAPRPRKGVAFEFQYRGGLLNYSPSNKPYLMTGEIIGKGRGKNLRVMILKYPSEILDDPKLGPAFRGTDDKPKNRPVVELDLDSLLYKGKQVEKSDRSYEGHQDDWIPTAYSKKNSNEWFAELVTTLVLGHLPEVPSSWLLSVIKTGEARMAGHKIQFRLNLDTRDAGTHIVAMKKYDTGVRCTTPEGARAFIDELSLRFYGRPGGFKEELADLLKGEPVWFDFEHYLAETAANVAVECPEPGVRSILVQHGEDTPEAWTKKYSWTKNQKTAMDEAKPPGPYTIDARFPKLINGSDDDGRDIRDATGKVLGTLSRKVEWVDVGHASARYSAKVTGYVVTDWWADEAETTYPTLALAMQAARAAFPGLTVAK